MTSADITRLRALLAKVSPGPWEAGNASVGYVDGLWEWFSADGDKSKPHDAAFIAYARTSLPDLLDALEAAWAKAEAAEREADRWRHGEPVDGDFVCPDALERDALRAEVEKLREENEFLKWDRAQMYDAWLMAEEENESLKKALTEHRGG